MKQTFKIIISPTKLESIPYRFRPKINAPPTFSHGEIRWGKHKFKDHN
jgi:hypothetical protein